MMYKRNSVLLIFYELAVLTRQYLLVYIFVIAISSIWKNGAFISMAYWYIIITFLLNASKKVYDWFSFQYMINEDSIQIVTGCFLRDYKTIYLAKIQQINVHQNVIYRILKKSFLEIDMGADSDNGKVNLKMIGKKEGESIDNIVKDLGGVQKDNKTTRNSPLKNVLHISSIKEIFLLSIVTAQMLFILPFAYTLHSKYGENTYIKGIINEAVFFFSKSLSNKIILITVMLLLAIVYGFIISYIKYGKYKLLADKDNLIIQSGFIQIRKRIVAKENIKALIYSRPLILRLFGFTRVKIFVSTGKFSDGKNSNMIIPVISIKGVNKIINKIDPIYAYPISFEKINIKLLGMYAALTPCLFLFTPLLNIKYILFLLIIYFYLVLRIINNKISIDLKKEKVSLKMGVFNQSIYVVKKEDIEVIKVSENPFKRIARLATLHIFIRKSPVKRLKLINVDDNKRVKLANLYNSLEKSLKL